MRTLIYKRTHSGDPDPETGVFGNNGCMGQVRGWSFDAVIGIGGIGGEPIANGIAGLLTWVGIGVHREGDSRRPVLKFDHFKHWGKRGPPVVEIAPTLAKRIYGKNIRLITSSSLTDTELAEVDAILNRAKTAPPSGRAGSRWGATSGTSDKNSSGCPTRPC